LRTSVALEAMERIVAEVEDVIVAAGTVVSARDLERSAKAGAQFAFSPGLADFMLQEGPIPILPGVATPSELMKAMSTGIDTFKFFPAVPAGGVGALKAFGGPFSDIAFCPTGGIDQHNAHEFLALPNVLCIGGSWVAPQKAIEAGDWAAITALAKDASALRPART
jgi:2-dehydro-3-deoxyphosphogluconate aldolase/(4S)-4-hydroxy-2-oxoglutarate aldolase